MALGLDNGVIEQAITNAVGPLSGGVEDAVLTLTNRRSIAGYIPQVVIEERHRDRLKITEHPIESGANISDHAYKEMPTLEMRVAWRWLQNGLITRFVGEEAFGDPYQDLLVLQDRRELFNVATGKRNYTNMLLSEIEITTDPDTENNLMTRLTFQKMLIVDQVKPEDVSGFNTNANTLGASANTKTNKGSKTLSGFRGTVNQSRGLDQAQVNPSGNIEISNL